VQLYKKYPEARHDQKVNRQLRTGNKSGMRSRTAIIDT